MGLLGLILMAGTFFIFPEWWIGFDQLTRETNEITRWEYFSHQWVILWGYLGRVVWPFPQLLDYGIQLNSFSSALVVFAG